MKKIINQEQIAGYVYQHDLAIKTVKNESSNMYNKEYIGGSIEVAVDEDLLNVVSVYFPFVTEETLSGKVNATYGILKRIIEEDKTVIKVGKEEALKVKLNPSLGLNDFINRDNQIISAKRNEGGFASIVTALPADRNKFKVDMLVTAATRVEADEEKHIDKDYVIIKGYIFDFKGSLLPVDFKVTNEQGMAYFEDTGISVSEPLFTQVWGLIKSETIVTEVTEESAFGEPAVRTYTKKNKEWVVTGARPTPYELGIDITKEELEKAMADREIHLAEVKKKHDEYQESKTKTENTFGPAVKAVTPKAGGFDF